MKNLKRSQLALSNFPYYKYSLDYTLDSLERTGGPCVEFYACYPHFYLGDATLADMKRLAKKIRNHHLKVIDFCPENCTYPVNVASDDLRARMRSVEYYVRGIQSASELECPYALFFPGWTHIDASEDIAWKRGLESFKYLADVAEGYGITLVLEVANKHNSILNSTDKQLAFLEAVNSPACNRMLDITNLDEVGETFDESFAKLGIEHIKHVHFKNNHEIGPGRYENTTPDEGFLDLKHIVLVLDEVGYKEYFGCECFGPYMLEPEKAMIQFRDWFDALEPIKDY
jgi:protein FrlC